MVLHYHLSLTQRFAPLDPSYTCFLINLFLTQLIQNDLSIRQPLYLSKTVKARMTRGVSGFFCLDYFSIKN